MLFDNNRCKMCANIRFNVKLYYYRYFDPYRINHYNLINKLVTYQNIALRYLKKYKGATVFSHLNENLYNSNPKAKEEFEIESEMQRQIKNL